VKSQINDFKTQNLVPKYTKIKIFRGSLQRSPRPLAGGEGAPPLSALRASSFGPSGLADSSPHFLNRGYAYARPVSYHFFRHLEIGAKKLYKICQCQGLGAKVDASPKETWTK